MGTVARIPCVEALEAAYSLMQGGLANLLEPCPDGCCARVLLCDQASGQDTFAPAYAKGIRPEKLYDTPCACAPGKSRF